MNIILFISEELELYHQYLQKMVDLNFGSFLGNKTLKIMIFNPKISKKNCKKMNYSFLMVQI